MKSDSLKNMFTAKAPLSLYGGLDKGAIGPTNTVGDSPCRQGELVELPPTKGDKNEQINSSNWSVLWRKFDLAKLQCKNTNCEHCKKNIIVASQGSNEQFHVESILKA